MEIFKNKKIKEILRRYRRIYALSYAKALLSWDSETYMPPGAAEERGIVEGILSSIIKDFTTSKEFVNLVREAELEENLNDYEKGVLRVLKRKIHYYESLPKEFLEEFEKVTNEAKVQWRIAKEKGDFKIFEPYLEKIVELCRKKAEYLGYEKHPYDALLDLYEEGMRTHEVEKILEELEADVKKLLKRIMDAPDYFEKHELEDKEYDVKKIKELEIKILDKLGFDFKYQRFDASAHPFTENIGLFDIRITTRFEGKDFKKTILHVVHEFGHALYEFQINKALWMTPLQSGVSLGIHESQSRFWENIVGRSLEFIEYFYELFKRYLSFLKDYTPEEIFRYFNLVRPELIRIDADEVSYNLHIILRFQIEKSLIEGSLDVKEVRDVWNEKMMEYFGIEPKNDAEGVLQDIHWSLGSVGYFPTYTLGTIVASQLYFKFIDERGEIGDIIRAGKFDVLRDWLREKIHRYGSTYEPKELLRRSVGEVYNPKKLVEYLKKKFKMIYTI